MIRGHKIRLYPNNKQETYFKKACGIARFSYNWALSEWKRRSEAGKLVTEAVLRKELNAVKRVKYPWMLEVTKCAPQLAIKIGLGNAIMNYQAKRAGPPQFHRKFVNDSFSISNDQFIIIDDKVRVPCLGWVRMAECLRFDGKIIGAAINRTADEWHISVQVEMPDAKAEHASENQAVGVDLGVKNLAILSDGTVVAGSKAGKKYGQRLRRLNKELSRRKGAKKGEAKSRNFIKTKRKISRLYARAANIRLDDTHKLTTMLAANFGLIGIENLNIKGMMSNHKLARSIADMSFFEIRRQLEYKTAASGAKLVIADRWYASSKTCSVCGYVNSSLELKDREWVCINCGEMHERDYNASINLKNYAMLNA